jgi:hypothetical protein
VILSSRKLDYDAESSEDAVKALMQSQHKAVLKDLKQGRFDDKIDEYLGDHEELRPRLSKVSTDTDEFNKPAEEVSQAPVPAVPEAAPEPMPADATVPNSVPLPIDNGATTRTPQPEASKPGVATVFGPGPGVGRPRIPTPIAIPVQESSDLGEPTVTFSDRSAVPTPVATDSSGAYSQVNRRHRPSAAPAPKSASPSTRTAAAGKAANPPPGRPKSSVVVSRPAVIIGAPPKVVGGGGSGEANRQQTRKARPDPGIFGKDLISEKSLDEVILAYLSEDGEE